jgi:hypothetical protein
LVLLVGSAQTGADYHLIARTDGAGDSFALAASLLTVP